MQDSVCVTPGLLCETPTADTCFKFPPTCAFSVDSFKKASIPLSLRSGRSFTPYKNSLFVKSPDFSPIEVIRLSRERISVAIADSSAENESLQLEKKQKFNLMPPPNGKQKNKRQTLPATMREMPKANAMEDRAKFLPKFSNVSDWQTSKKDLDRRVLTWLSNQRRRRSFHNVDLNKTVNVASILEGLHLTQYAKCFAQMDLRKFLTLKDSDLEKIGISDRMDRRAIRRAIQYYQI